MRSWNLAALAASSLAIIGCATPRAFTTTYLYPIHGPLAARHPIPVIEATVDTEVTALARLRGPIAFTLPDGETFSGRWSREAYIDSSPEQLARLRETDIQDAWDAVYGDGCYVATVLGSLIHARAELVGSKGTHMQVEFNNAQPFPTRGVAKDDKGNIFKIYIP